MPQMNKKAILIIASVALVAIALGVTAFFLTRDKGVAAVVNGIKISSEEVETEMNKAISQYESQGMALQPEQRAEMRMTIIDNMIIREVLLQESVSYEPTAEELDAQIATFKENFDTEEAFLEALGTQGFDLDGFKNIIGEDLKIQKMIEDRVPEETEVSDEDMITFYNENPSYFTQQERIHASHILVTLAATMTDEEKASALDKISRIEQELKDGADFAVLAKEQSEGPSGPNGGDLGEFPRGQMVGDFETVAFALQEGTISGVVETQFGYHIIKLHERFPESSVPFEEVKESINSFLVQEKSQNKLTDFLEELKAEANIRIPEHKAEPAGETPEEA